MSCLPESDHFPYVYIASIHSFSSLSHPFHPANNFQGLFDYDFTSMEEALGADCLDMIRHYEGTSGHGKVFNKRIRDRICELSRHLARSASPEEFKEIVTGFYKEFGVGKLGLHKAFRIEHTEEGARIVPITKIAHVHLDDLVGYELAKKKLIDNTEAFVQESGQITVCCLVMREPENRHRSKQF